MFLSAPESFIRQVPAGWGLDFEKQLLLEQSSNIGVQNSDFFHDSCRVRVVPQMLLLAEVTLRVLPLQVQQLGWSFPLESQLQHQGMLCQVSSQQNHPVVSWVNSSQKVQDMINMTSSKRTKADTHCLVALCASSATVLLTLHPSASVLLSEIYFCLAPATVYWKRAFDHVDDNAPADLAGSAEDPVQC